MVFECNIHNNATLVIVSTPIFGNIMNGTSSSALNGHLSKSDGQRHGHLKCLSNSTVAKIRSDLMGCTIVRVWVAPGFFFIMHAKNNVHVCVPPKMGSILSQNIVLQFLSVNNRMDSCYSCRALLTTIAMYCDELL